MIIYGTFTETSVPKLFMAGVIPGLIMTAMFMIYIARHALVRPGVAPREHGTLAGRVRWRRSRDVVPFALLIGGIARRHLCRPGRRRPRPRRRLHVRR